MQASDSGPIRIAMWSGPRNISTALMRSWEARGDTHVCDEPFYAHYLEQTGTSHPGREEIVSMYETDWREVVKTLAGTIPGEKRIYYQKHMAHHLLSYMLESWLGELRHAFLIRDPRAMLPSLASVMADPDVDDTGLPQQCALFDYVSESIGQSPPIIDAREVLEQPERMLQKLCRALGVSYTSAMLSWRRGLRPTDGIWGRYWYTSVRESTGFRAYHPPDKPLPHKLSTVYEACIPYYERLHHHRLTP